MIEWPPDLVEEIARRKCVIYIGSGVSANSIGTDGICPPTWKRFLEDALKIIVGPKKHITAHLKRGDLLNACEIVKQRLDDRWSSFLRERFVTPKFRPAEIHKHIFALDARIVITPNFDQIYDRYAKEKSEGTITVKSYSDPDVIHVVRSNDRYIFKIHGDIDSPAQLIFTRKQYASARTSHPNVYRIIESLLVVNSFLFIGCGLSDPDITLLMEDNNFLHSHAAPHYILLPKPIHVDDVRLIKETRNLIIISYDKSANHKALSDGVAELSKLVETAREDLKRTGNW